MYPDKDAPGEHLYMQLKEILPSLVHHQLPPGCKDFSDYFLKSFVCWLVLESFCPYRAIGLRP